MRFFSHRASLKSLNSRNCEINEARCTKCFRKPKLPQKFLTDLKREANDHDCIIFEYQQSMNLFQKHAMTNCTGHEKENKDKTRNSVQRKREGRILKNKHSKKGTTAPLLEVNNLHDIQGLSTNVGASIEANLKPNIQPQTIRYPSTYFWIISEYFHLVSVRSLKEIKGRGRYR